MTEQEVEAVATELARASKILWPSGPASGPRKMVLYRYKDRARLAIAAVDRVRATQQDAAPKHHRSESLELVEQGESKAGSSAGLSVSTLVLYWPRGDQRARRCRITKIESDRTYLVPESPDPPGWVDLESLSHSIVG
jgi:hypothetical protein